MPRGRIDSVSDFLHELDEWRARHFLEMQGEVSSLTFFRGQANAEWMLQPLLYRSDLYLEEQNMVADALRLLPNEFHGMSDLQKLGKMQHFGLPTRLLDVTTNPLAALYFACAGEEGKDGKVFVFPNLPTPRDHGWLVPVITQFIFHGQWQGLDMDRFIEQVQRRSSTLGDHRRDNSTITHALCVPVLPILAAHDNERLQAQSGAFLMIGMEERSRDTARKPGSTYVDFQPAELTASVGHPLRPDAVPKGGLEFVVPAVAKQRVLRQLDQIDVNRWRLFPGPDGALKYIHDAYSNSFREGAQAARTRLQAEAAHEAFNTN